MRLFLTGGTGLLGRYFADMALGNGAEIVALVRPTSNTAHLKSAGATLHMGDLADPKGMAAGMAGCDAVVHLAAIKGGWRKPSSFEQSIVQGTKNVIQAMETAGVRKLIYVSSICVHGLDPIMGQSVSEASGFSRNFLPHDDYGRAKMEAERAIKSACEQDKINATVVRPGWFYGPGDAGYAHLVKRLKQRLLFQIGSGENRLPLVYVGNVAEVLWRCVSRSSDEYQVFLYAADGAVTQNEYFESLKRAAGKNVRPIKVPQKLLLPLATVQEKVSRLSGYRLPTLQTRQFVYLWGSNWQFDQGRLERELGINLKIEPKTGLSLTEKWYHDVHD